MLLTDILLMLIAALLAPVAWLACLTLAALRGIDLPAYLRVVSAYAGLARKKGKGLIL